ncbi:hypothetical protein ILUMI_19206 [Ignelater luminosus]|uniref:Cytochrome P450 n=1 Tax=Ignelater luminosus TaxID=2038154 RepID=A0A8K0CKM6_IGNLU|nr:hypothetical protein ILUMI_19206 [Ignelater luminosus]
MLNRTLTVSCNVGVRFISTANTTKNVDSATITAEAKEAYYKNLGTNFGVEDNTKPAGWDEALPYKSIPGPKALPIIGNVWRFFPYVGDLHNIDVLEMHRRFYKQYGKIAKLGGIPTFPDTVFIFSPEDFEVLHRNEGAFPIRDALKAFQHYRTVVRKDIFKDVGGVTTVHGIDWYNFRSKVNPILMQPRTAQQYADSMNVIANDFLANVKRFTKSHPTGEMPEDFLNHIYRWALESIAYIALDRRLGCLDPNLRRDSEPQKIIDSAIRMFYLYYKIEVLPTLWKVYKTKTFREFIDVLDTMTFTFLKYINEATERIKKDKTPKEEHQMSVFQRLLKIDQKVAMAMAMDMLTAGVDTTGRTTGAALYFLAKNTEAQNALRKELRSLMPNKDSPVTKEVLTNASYLRAVIKETTRIAPISVGNFRQAIKDMVLCGYQIPKGTNLLTCNLVLCHSDEYFPEASQFIPERWLRSTTGEMSHKNTHPFVHLPFGFGPRSCIGKRLANLELEIVVAKMVRNFNLEWHHEDMKYVCYPLYGIASPLKLQLTELED